MKALAITVIAASALTGGALLLAGTAGAAPSGPNTADQTIAQLQHQGLHVVVNKVGSAPLNQCTVAAVRPGQTVVHMRSDTGTVHSGIVTVVDSRSVSVDLAC